MNRLSLWLAAIAISSLLIAHGYALGRAPQDDAFISFRYAKNLIDGHGLVYNPGERVEGYTNFLWTIAMTPIIAAGVDPFEGSRALGMLFATATVLLLLLAPHVGPAEGAARRRWVGAAATLLLVSSSSFVAEAVGGLETALFSFLVTALLLRVEYEEGRGRGGVLSGLLGGLAALTRPEGALVLLGTSLHRILPVPFGTPRAAPRRLLPPALVSAAVCMSFALSHRLVAWAYYGRFLPNTFYAKVGGGWSALGRGALYAGDFILAWLPVLVLALFGLVPLRGWQRTLRAGFLAGYAAYIIAVGGDYKWTLRFFVPLMPVTALLAAEGMGSLAALAERPASRRALACALAGGMAILIYLSSHPAREFCEIRRFRYERDRVAGTWFAHNAPPGSLLATVNAGVLPYYAGLPTIDMLGLTDSHIAHTSMPAMGVGEAGHEKADGGYVLSRRPEIVLFHHTRVTDGPVPAEEAGRLSQFVAETQLWQNPILHQEYEWVSVPLSGYSLNFFRRRSTPAVSSSSP